MIGGIAKVRGISDSGNGLSSATTPEQIAQQNEQLNQLYQLLIDPVKGSLPTNSGTRLIFVPQGSLNFVPFAALRDSSGQYLIEKYTIATAPNLRSLRLSRQNRERLGDSKGNALVVGNPEIRAVQISDGLSSQQLDQLPFAETEAKEVAQELETQGFNTINLAIKENAI